MKSGHRTSCILATATTILLAAFASGASDSRERGKAEAGAAIWPMFRGNPALTGVAAGNLPDKLSLLWSFKTGGPIKSSAAIVEGRVFIGSGDGQVYALELGDGKKAWAAKTGGPVDSSPLVLGGRVFFGSVDNSLYAVEAASGKQIWKYETGDKILGAPNWVKSPRGDAD
jgi:eukaryotic-like serine/threonine-protein kinase